jgi:hypothetical protein
METTMSRVSESSRRAFLTALAASGAAATVLPGVGHAQSAGGAGVGFGTAPGAPLPFPIQAFPAPVPGTNYTFILGGDFQPTSSGSTYIKVFGGIEPLPLGGNGDFYFALRGLPAGARITEVIFAVVKSSTYTGDATVLVYRMTSGSNALLDFKDTSALGQQDAEQYLSLTVGTDNNWVVDNEQAATHWLAVAMSSSRLNSVRVGWTLPHPRTFIPINPKRVYDSRFIAPLGPLANNTNRVISVANGYTVATATVDLPNVVPAGAQAISYNLTIANTVGSGFLSVAPGDAVTLGGSSINWFTSGLSLANGLVVKLDANRQIKVFCGGGGSSDFIIDILGYYI